MSFAGFKYYLMHPTRIYAYFAKKGYLNWVPDSVYLKFNYKMKTGRKLNLKNPETFNEKIQYLKLYDRKPLYSRLVDKYDAKLYVSKILGDSYIVENYGVWDKFEEINFDELPNEFVLKCTHDSGGLIICRDKKNLNIHKAQAKIEKCLKRNYYFTNREWPYKNVKPRIIAEKYMELDDDSNQSDIKGLVDYKFFCFNGEAKFVYISKGLENHDTAGISFYDLEGKELPFYRSDFKQIHEFVFPENFDEMIKIANKLASEIMSSFLRVDLYSLYNHIYFSEITFSPCGGYIPFVPLEYDYIIGKMLDLNFQNYNNDEVK